MFRQERYFNCKKIWKKVKPYQDDDDDEDYDDDDDGNDDDGDDDICVSITPSH